jgi:hypothetical protein
MNAAIACGVLYIVFMVTVDVPMYVSRWLASLSAAQEPLTLLEGFRAIAQRCHVVWDWNVWREDATWLTLYFTAAVWLSILLPHVPLFRRRAEAASPPPASAKVQTP